MFAALRLSAILTISFAVPSVARCEIVVDPISLEGSNTGTLDGIQFGSVRGSMNERGEIAIQASLVGAGVTPLNNFAVFHYAGTDKRLIARKGDTWPGLDGVIDTLNYGLGRSSDAALRVETVGAVRQSALFVESGSSYRLLARGGMPAPGTTLTFPAAPSLDSMWDANNLTVNASIGAGASLESSVLYRAKADGTLQLLQRPTAQAPGFPAGTNYVFATGAVSRNGSTFVKTFVRDAQGQSSNLYYGASDNGINSLIRRGTPLPVNALMPVSAFEITESNRPLPGGQFAASARFSADVSPTAPISTSLVRGTQGGFSVTSFPTEWQAFPPFFPGVEGLAPNESLDLFRSLTVRDDGSLFGYAAVSNSTSNSMLVTGNVAAPRVGLRLSGPVPGLTDVTFGDNPNLFRIGIDDAGNRVFITNLLGDGVDSGNDMAYFLLDSANHPSLLLREGQTIRLSDGSERTVAELRDLTLGGINKELILSRDHELLVNVRFADNTQGVLRIVVPEPAIGSMVTAAAVLVRRRRRSA